MNANPSLSRAPNANRRVLNDAEGSSEVGLILANRLDDDPALTKSGSATACTVSWAMASAAYSSAARTDSRVSRGCDSRICSIDSPRESLRRIVSTVMPVPRTTGFAVITSGSD